ncbi:MAG: DUF2891 domain-containing protein [Bdellovibrionales bacterium]|nr:DUF2891 domain-containing protein [Bdellovibrionales bacterium]
MAAAHAAATQVAARPPSWDRDLAERLVQLSLGCVDKEFPNHWERFYPSKTPREIHPVFFGCYDWHSAVHGHWAMVRVAREFPDLPSRGRIIETLERKLEDLSGELPHFEKFPHFESPYGWGWFLRLSAEIRQSGIPGAPRWTKAMEPLEKLILGRFQAWLPKLTGPDREPMHLNTAYSLAHVLAWARITGNAEMDAFVTKHARRLFAADKNCPIDYEPGSMDFVSPCFMEAALMAEVMTGKEYARWLRAFLPRLTRKTLAPVVPTDSRDPYLGHLIGLLFSKGGNFERIAERLPLADPRRAPLLAAAKKMTATGLEKMFDSGYGGEHWLATFAIHRFTR